MYLLTNERYKTYQTGFSFGRLGHVPGVEGTMGGWGSNHFFSKLNQIWCVSYLHEGHMHGQFFGVLAPWGLGRGPKGQISLNQNYKVNFKDF